MLEFRATTYDYELLRGTASRYYPLLRNDKGKEAMWCLTPLHGRSFVVGQCADGRWIVSKGNGLSYSSDAFLCTPALGKDVWGGLDKYSALRDFEIGNEVCSLGIKTNQMDGVLLLDTVLTCGDTTFQPSLLQYTVECPYRITDYPFMQKSIVNDCIKRWRDETKVLHNDNHLIAAGIMLANLRTLRDNNILHNAYNAQNYTWALELLDFEASRSNLTPYDNPEYEAMADMLMNGEVIQAYQTIIYIAGVLGENPDFNKIDNLFKDYGFDLNPHVLSEL